MVLEKAYIKYSKNGDYDYTIASEYLKFKTDKEAREYIAQHIEHNVEYYFYNDINSTQHYDVIICNEL